MTKAELDALVRGLSPVLKDYMAVILAKDRGRDGAAGPAGPDGKPGRDGQPGIPGRDGQRGEKGTDGIDGKAGTNGVDGLGFNELDAVYDDIGRMSLKFTCGTRVKVFRVPSFVDRGVWKEGTTYEKGDGATYGGSFWIARDATTEKPGEGATKWRLAVKAGREGREGKPGRDGDRGLKGEKGDPGRNFS